MKACSVSRRVACYKLSGKMLQPTDVATVLVVDDEPGIRALARRALEQAGYQVLEASNGSAAISLLAEGPRLDLLIADLNMPGLGGNEMVRRIRTTRPDLKVLYVSGHISRLMDARPLWEAEAFLNKPFTNESLREAVSLLLYGTLKKPD
jgi:two-component system, cell cycle sensor histidine kinase and response regulator CckA